MNEADNYNQAEICSHIQKNQYRKKKKWQSCRWDLVAQYRYFHHGASLVLNLKIKRYKKIKIKTSLYKQANEVIGSQTNDTSGMRE